MAERSTQMVLEDHLELDLNGETEADIERNFAEDVVLLTSFGVFYGRDGVRESRRLLKELLPDVQLHYRTRLVAGEIGFLEWSAASPRAYVEDGADSYFIRDGLIRVQTIHYTVKPNRD